MTLRSMFLSVAAASIALAPVSAAVAAPTNPAAKLSVSKSVRGSTATRNASSAIATPLIILFVVVVVVGAVVVVGGDNDSESA